MGASVRTEDEAFSDERYSDLARAAGLADADHARGKMSRLWRQCTIEQTYFLTRETVCGVLGDRGVEALIAARLGEVTEHGIRIRGTKGRIEWLKKLRGNGKFGKRGGRPKKNPDGFPTKPTRVSKNTELETPPAPAPAPAQDLEEPPNSPPKGGRRSRSVYASQSEERAFQAVMLKLSEASGIAYRGGDEHRRLVLSRLRDGIHELELRAVIAYCADEWHGKSDLAAYLRPETLFGPKTIHRYLDAARTKYARELRDAGVIQPQPKLEVVK